MNKSIYAISLIPPLGSFVFPSSKRRLKVHTPKGLRTELRCLQGALEEVPRGLKSEPPSLPLHSLGVKFIPTKRVSKAKFLQALICAGYSSANAIPDAKGQLQTPQQELKSICSQSKKACISVPGSFIFPQSHEMSCCLWLHG